MHNSSYMYISITPVLSVCGTIKVVLISTNSLHGTIIVGP